MSARQTTAAAAQVVAFPESAVSLVDAFVRGLPSVATRTAYRWAIQSFAEFLGRDLLTASRRDIEAHRANLEAAGRAPATIAKVLSALSGFYDFAVDEGVIDRNPATSARRPKVADTSPRRALSPAEVRAILAVPDVSKLVGLRDRALLVTLVVQGWRVSEALGLRVEDLAEEGGHKVATICGKGGKVARVPLAAATWQAITAWLESANATTGPVFVAVTKGGVVVAGEAVSQQAAWKRLQSIAEKAGVARHVHAHLFRHGAVTTALASGVPLHQVQDFARHADPRTTRRCDSHRASLANPAPHVLAAALVE
jgi:site-specific recombinase XerD